MTWQLGVLRLEHASCANSVEVLPSNYLGVINEPRGRALVDAEGATQVARAPRVRHLAEGACDCYRPKPHGNREALFRTRTGDPLLTMEVLYQLS